jgi:hypothetical protein
MHSGYNFSYVSLLHVTSHEVCNGNKHEKEFSQRKLQNVEEGRKKRVLKLCNCNADDFNQAECGERI